MLGHRKNKWTKEEEDVLLAGIAKHGAGKWKCILDDPDFAAQLPDRTNIDLKDKWRNMKNRARPIKEKSKTQALKSASICISPHLVRNDDMSNEFRCEAMVFEAISTINDENGSNLSGILSFIEERYEVPQNFRKMLSNSLRLLVSQDKLEKLLNRYKISATKPTQTLNPKDSVVSATSKETQVIDSAVEVEEIDEWHEEPQTFNEFASEILTILISQGKLEKVFS